jgi:hypothetical protein
MATATAVGGLQRHGAPRWKLVSGMGVMFDALIGFSNKCAKKMFFVAFCLPSRLGEMRIT